MMAKPIRALELHYPMIQFLIKRNVQFCRYSSSRSCPSSCILAVFAMLWGSSSPTSSQSCSTIFYMVLLLYQNNETSSPGLLGYLPFSGDYPVLLTFYSGYRKHLPNLFNTSRGLTFERAYLRSEIFVSKSIALALQLEVNLPFLLCFTLYLGQFSKYKPPGGRGNLMEVFFLRWRFGGAYIWRGLYMEGLIFGILR